MVRTNAPRSPADLSRRLSADKISFSGCLGTSFIDGRWGRLSIAHVGSAIISVGAIIQASSFTVAQLIVGRIIAGIGLGLITSNLAVWQSETAASNIRGTLVAVSLSFLILGQVLAYWIDYAMSEYPSSVSWRFPMAFQAFLGIILSIMLVFMPECKWPASISFHFAVMTLRLNFEAPRWLFQNDRQQEASEILRLLRSSKGVVDENALATTVTEIRDALALENQQKGWLDLVRDDHIHSRRRVALACLLNACQAWSGSTPISYYTTVM